MPQHVSSVSGAYGTGDARTVAVADVPNRVLLFEYAGKTGAEPVSRVTYGGRAR